MVSRDFSGEELYKVLVNVGNFRHGRTTGDHLILKWGPPADHTETDTRTVVMPAHDSVSIGTSRDIADYAGAEDFEAFCAWIARNS